MDDKQLEGLPEMAFAVQARIDVLERAVALFMVNNNRPLSRAIEVSLRRQIEFRGPLPDTIEAEKLRATDAAAVRFASLVADALG